jgi:hypothetical protein
VGFVIGRMDGGILSVSWVGLKLKSRSSDAHFVEKGKGMSANMRFMTTWLKLQALDVECMLLFGGCAGGCAVY